MVRQFPNNSAEIPSIVVIGVPDQATLRDVMERLVRYGIRFAAFYEPDWGTGLSAISTVPLTKKQRYALNCYPLWEPKESSVAYSNGAEDVGGPVTPGCSWDSTSTPIFGEVVQGQDIPAGIDVATSTAEKIPGTAPGLPHQYAGSSVGVQSAGAQVSEVEGSSPSPRAKFGHAPTRVVSRQARGETVGNVATSTTGVVSSCVRVRIPGCPPVMA
jgi:hypothetical protein